MERWKGSTERRYPLAVELHNAVGGSISQKSQKSAISPIRPLINSENGYSANTKNGGNPPVLPTGWVSANMNDI
jgi:hypothetical protein